MDEVLNFEQAFARLEAILDQMNTGKVTLDSSLKLYQEADSLIRSCSDKLMKAEEQIETLIKDRQGKLIIDKEGRPETQAFELVENI